MLATIDELLAADRLIHEARTRAADLMPGDWVLFHEPLPGSMFCTIPVIGTVVESIDANPNPTQLYPKSRPWRLRIEVDGQVRTWGVSSEFTGCLRAAGEGPCSS